MTHAATTTRAARATRFAGRLAVFTIAEAALVAAALALTSDDADAQTAQAGTVPGYKQINLDYTGLACVTAQDGWQHCWGTRERRDFYSRQERYYFPLRTTIPAAGYWTQYIQGSQGEQCVLEQKGTIHCWGNGWHDNGRDLVKNVPDGRYTKIIRMTAHNTGWFDVMCALAQDGTIHCWGDKTAKVATPPNGRYTQILSGVTTGCALAQDGAIRCWG